MTVETQTVCSYLAANSINYGLTRYLPSGGVCYGNSTEAQIQMLVRDTLTGHNLFANCTLNSLNGSSTLRTRKNAGNGAASVSIGSSTTGFFEDTSNSDSLASGDLYNNQIVTGGSSGSITLSTVGIQLQHASTYTQMLVSTGDPTVTFGSTSYTYVYGYCKQESPESYTKWQSFFNTTLSKLRVYVTANTCSSSTTVYLRKGGSNANQSVSIGAYATGAFEDTSDTDSISNGDIINYAVTPGSGTPTMSLFQMRSQNSIGYTYAPDNVDTSANYGTTYYSTPIGGYSLTTTETKTQFISEIPLHNRDLFGNVSYNGLNGSTTAKSRLNAGDGAMSFSVGAGATGTFSDTSNSDTVAAGDKINNSIVTGGTSGVISFCEFGSTINQFSTENIDVSDSGSGTDAAPTIEEDLSQSDSGSGSDSVTSISESLDQSDSGTGDDSGVAVSETGIDWTDSGGGSETVSVADSEFISASDSGTGTDGTPVIEEDLSQTDAGSGADSTTIQDSIPISDAGSGADVVDLMEPISSDDSGSGVDVGFYWVWIDVTDEGLGVDVAYLTQGEISLDGVDLPHVLVVNVDEPSIVQDLPIIDRLPYRRQVAKKGRSLRIQGWTDSVATLEALREYADGEKHLLLLPTGDSMSILVSGVQTPEDVTKYTTYNYTITAAEAVD